MNIDIKTGIGFDVHKYSKTRELILGGVTILSDKGLEGHSDADVLLHAITDAMLGALALGDIGQHFPDSDIKYKNADSLTLLKEVYELVMKKNYELGNIDSVIMMEHPKLAPYIPEMRKRISDCLGVSIEKISVKATTTEHLGFVGREEGAAAMATVLVHKRNK